MAAEVHLSPRRNLRNLCADQPRAPLIHHFVGVSEISRDRAESGRDRPRAAEIGRDCHRSITFSGTSDDLLCEDDLDRRATHLLVS